MTKKQDEKVDAWMPLWIGSYLADTMALTTQQHGAYLLLLFAYWRNRGPLEDNDEDLASICKASPEDWPRLRAKLLKFFVAADGLWSHKRADEELQKAGVRKVAAVAKAKAAADARWGKGKGKGGTDAPSNAPSIPQALHEDCPTPSPITDSALPPPPPAGARTPTHEGGPIGPEPPPAPPEDEGPVELDVEAITGGQPPTIYGSVVWELRRAGIGKASSSHREFQQLVDAGATAEEFLAHVEQALTKNDPFTWIVRTVANERVRLAKQADQLHRGPMPTRPAAAAPPQETFRERDQRLARERYAEMTGTALPQQRPAGDVIDITPKQLGAPS